MTYFQETDSYVQTHVVVCTDLSCKAYIQVGVGSVVTVGNLGGVIVSTLARNARDVFDSHSRHNISHLHHTHDIQMYIHFNTMGQTLCKTVLGLFMFKSCCVIIWLPLES